MVRVLLLLVEEVEVVEVVEGVVEVEVEEGVVGCMLELNDPNILMFDKSWN